MLVRSDEMPSIAARARGSRATDVLPLKGTLARAAAASTSREAVSAALDEHAVTPPSPRATSALREAIARDACRRRRPGARDPGHERRHARAQPRFRALLEPGDEVIVPTPCFFFGGLIERAGGVFVPVPRAGIREAIEQAVTPRSRALVLTNPNNPDGYLPSRAEVDELLALAVAARPDGDHRRGVRALHPRGRARVRLGRAERDPGPQPRQEPRDAAWRIGFVAAEPSVIDACLRELEWDVIRVSHVAQRAATAALDGPQDWLDEVAARLPPGSRRSPRRRSPSTRS